MRIARTERGSEIHRMEWCEDCGELLDDRTIQAPLPGSLSGASSTQVMNRKFRTRKIDAGLYIAMALPGEHAYGHTRRAAIQILKHNLCN